MSRYREFDLDAPDYEPMLGWSSDADTDDLAAWLANIGTTPGAGDAGATPSWLQPTPPPEGDGAGLGAGEAG